jgi:hypothetical protein
MIKLELMLIYDTAIVTSRLFIKYRITAEVLRERSGLTMRFADWKGIIHSWIIPAIKALPKESYGSYRNTDEVWWRYGISRSCDECMPFVSSHSRVLKNGDPHYLVLYMPYYDSSHWNYFRKSSMMEVLK